MPVVQCDPYLRQVVAEGGEDHVVDGAWFEGGDEAGDGGVVVGAGPGIAREVGILHAPAEAALGA